MRAPFSAGWLAATCWALLAGGQAAAQTRPIYTVEAAIGLAQRTGRPILTIAGTTG